MKTAVHSRSLFVCLVLVAGFSALSGRLIYLQWIDRDLSALGLAESRFSEEVLPGRFGFIVDRNEWIMAGNLPVTKIIADNVHLNAPIVAARGVAFAELLGTEKWIHGTDEERTRLLRRRARRLVDEMEEDELHAQYIEHVILITARALGVRAVDLQKKFPSGKDWTGEVIVAKDLREHEADEIEETLQENYIFGFRFEKSVKRLYLYAKCATHTTGFVDHEGVGVCGIEKMFREFLRGKDGCLKARKNISGMGLLRGEGVLTPPRSGLDVKLALDLTIQKIVEEELDAGLEEFEATRGTVVMLDPKTGDVLAIASRPHFDLNLRENFKDASAHYAVELITPGSTMKLIATSAALDLGLMRPTDKVNCYYGRRQMKGFFVPDHHPYGMLTLEQVLSKSSNTGVYEIALRVGPTKFVEYLHKFGFEQKTGIALYRESKGEINDHKNPVNFSRMSYGYGVRVTPLQIACAYAAIANDGVRMKPRLVQALLAADGTEVQSFPPEDAQKVVTPSTAKKMRAALATVVNAKGTGKRAIVPGFIGCGKTGTADAWDKKLKKWIPGAVSFVGFLPRDDPAFVCVVVIDDPRTDKVKIGGGSVAAPIYQRIATRTAAFMNLTPTEPIERDEALVAAGP